MSMVSDKYLDENLESSLALSHDFVSDVLTMAYNKDYQPLVNEILFFVFFFQLIDEYEKNAIDLHLIV